MKRPLDERELVVLECLRDASGPIGSWSLVESLEGKGFKVSSASIGRILYRLEQREFVEGKGNQGRIITKGGLQAIKRTKAVNTLNSHRENLENLINSKVLEDYIMVLQARKAIERETARLAAENITETQEKELASILQDQMMKREKGESIADVDIAFHREIALASHNRALLALYGILATMGQQTELFEFLRRRVNAPYPSAHNSILQAICAHDPDGAEKSIIRHMDALIEDVTKYWDRYRE
jgi:GntR family transcriptional repressor for pyruvate dehydrogenase complex